MNINPSLHGGGSSSAYEINVSSDDSQVLRRQGQSVKATLRAATQDQAERCKNSIRLVMGAGEWEEFACGVGVTNGGQNESNASSTFVISCRMAELCMGVAAPDSRSQVKDAASFGCTSLRKKLAECALLDSQSVIPEQSHVEEPAIFVPKVMQ